MLGVRTTRKRRGPRTRRCGWPVCSANRLSDEVHTRGAFGREWTHPLSAAASPATSPPISASAQRGMPGDLSTAPPSTRPRRRGPRARARARRRRRRVVRSARRTRSKITAPTSRTRRRRTRSSRRQSDGGPQPPQPPRPSPLLLRRSGGAKAGLSHDRYQSGIRLLDLSI